MTPFIPFHRAINLTLDPLCIRTGEQVRATRTLDIDILNGDVTADFGAGADDVANAGIVLFARCALEVFDSDVGDCEVGGELSRLC